MIGETTDCKNSKNPKDPKDTKDTKDTKEDIFENVRKDTNLKYSDVVSGKCVQTNNRENNKS